MNKRHLNIFILVFILLFSFYGFVFAQMSLNLTIHSVETSPVQGELAHQVDVFVSVLEDDGSPISGIDASNFSILEDGEIVIPQIVETAYSFPISLVLVMDTSGSMAGNGIQQAKDAGTQFINRLSMEDQIAIMSFNEQVNTVTDFTTNHATANAGLDSLAAIANAGTCLYDAAYKAVEIASGLPSGRRAVLLLTDGRDELVDGSTCSAFIPDDAIELAQSTHTPIYTLGLGKEIDENVLTRMAGLTGGSFLSSDQPDDLQTLFNHLYDQLKYQYHISYESTASPGTHSLVVEVEIGQIKDQDSSQFLLSELPPVLKIVSPESDETIEDDLIVELSMEGQVEAINSLQFYLNEETLDYEEVDEDIFEIVLPDLEPNLYSLTVLAVDSSGDVLTSDTIDLYFNIYSGEYALTQTVFSGTQDANLSTESILEPGESEDNVVGGFVLDDHTKLYIGIGTGVVILAIVIIVLVSRRKKSSAEGEYGLATGEMTIDGKDLSGIGEVLAYLKVKYSDDSGKIGESYPVTKVVTKIGRGKMNDIYFENDSPVSRQHARIEYANGQFILSEIPSTQADGSKKYPTYGTYVNQASISGQAIVLSHQDEIQLGNRLKLEFQMNQDDGSNMEATFDDISFTDEETLDI